MNKATATSCDKDWQDNWISDHERLQIESFRAVNIHTFISFTTILSLLLPMPDISMGSACPPPRTCLQHPSRPRSPLFSTHCYSSQSQLGQELKQHVANATQSCVAKLQAMQEEVNSLKSRTSSFNTHWEQEGLSEAASLGTGLKQLFCSFTQQLKGKAPSPTALPHPTPTCRQELCPGLLGKQQYQHPSQSTSQWTS